MKITLSRLDLTNAIEIAKNQANLGIDQSSPIEISGKNSFLEVKSGSYESMVHIKKLPFVSDITKNSFKAISVDSKKLFSAVKSLKSSELVIDISSQYIVVIGGRSKVKIEILASSPDINIPSGETVLQVGDELIKSLKKVLHSADTNNPKYELNGILVQSKNGVVNCVSTDTRRMAITSTTADIENIDIIIGTKGVRSIIDLFNGCSVSAEISKTNLIINTDTISYACSLISGKFPDWKKIEPKTHKTEIKLDAVLFHSMVKEAMLFEKNLIVSLNHNSITITDSSRHIEVTEKYEDLNQDIIFGINGKYLSDFFEANNFDTFQLGFNESGLPISLQSNGEYKEIVMPVIVEIPTEESQEEAVA